MFTNHALQRTSERTGYNKRTSARFITNAIERGKEAEEFSSKEKNYLMQRVRDGRMVVYNSCCFVLRDENICITMFHTPEWFGKKILYDGKTKIRDARKYLRHSDNYMKGEYEYE